MQPSRPFRLWLLLAALPGPFLPAQTNGSDAAAQASYPCADTALTRWLPPDTAANRAKVEARVLYEHFLARTYSPILRFSPSEKYFPTLPFWTAFRDTVRVVTPMSEERPQLPSVFAVREAYDSALDLSQRPYELKPPLPVVFYRVCDLIAPDPDSATTRTSSDPASARRAENRRWRQKADYLWNYLRSDEQAWERFGLERARTSDTTYATDTTRGAGPAAGPQQGDSLIRRIQRFHVIQYFVYYLQDWGLAGHTEDIEYAFVFVPADTTAAKSFRVIVGAGHDPPAANNVLVMVSRDASKRRYYHPNILVELGGHSSAPDMPPFGQFSAGLDVNWHIGDLWGTRDEQAMAGLSFSGRYEGSMTFPRDPEDAVTLFPKGFGAGTDSGRQVLADLVRVSPDYLAERAHQASHLPDPPSAERRKLAENILGAYHAALEAVEARERDVIKESASRDAVQSKYKGQTDEAAQAAAQSEIIVAMREDDAARAANLGAIDDDRRDEVSRSVDSLLRRARCPDSLRARPERECPWLTDGARDSVRQDVVALLETRSRRIPADSLMSQLLATLPDPDSSKSTLDAITAEIRQVVTERLLPEYSLVPVRYLQALYQGAQGSADTNVAMVKRHLRLITRLLHPATCDELACGLHLLGGDEFDSRFDEVVCGAGGGAARDPGAVHWPRSLACQFDSSVVSSIRTWNGDVYDRDRYGKSKQWPAIKHKIWEHEMYRRPELIFRTDLFRPTLLQVKRSRAAFEGLLHGGYTLLPGRASHPYFGVIIPAFRSVGVPVKVPGYVAFQVGPYSGWPYENGATTLGMGLLYDRQFAYFYGLYLKGHWANNRSDAEAGSGASDFTWTFGASIWFPFAPRLHLRPGIRFDTDDLRPLLERTVWDLQFEWRR